MLLVEEKKSPSGRGSAEIYMRDDGLFEGRIYRPESARDNQVQHSNVRFEVCGITETLSRLEAIVDEELGL